MAITRRSARLAGTMDLQPVGIHHPRIKQLISIQKNTAPNRYQLFVAEGLWAQNALLEAGTTIEV